MRNQRGFMGCGTLFVVVWIGFMLAFWGLIRLKRNLFYVPPEKEMFTSRVAARRCRQKLQMFKNNEQVKSISLNKLEIDSAIHEEFAYGQHKPFLSVTVEMEPKRLSVESTVVLVELIPRKIRYILGGEENNKEKKEERRKAVVKLITQPVINQRGELFLNPHELTIGKQSIPHFIIKRLSKSKPEWFNYPISKKIKTIKVNEDELELIKW